jgi:hypothetical protein
MMQNTQHHQQLARVSATFDAEAFIHETLGFINMYSNMAQSCLEANDPACFNYAIACMTARVRTIVTLMNPAQGEPEEIGN